MTVTRVPGPVLQVALDRLYDDQLTQRRSDLPWEAVDNDYVFDGPEGKQTLTELCGGRSQLIVYRFMFDPDWEEGCKHCPWPFADLYFDATRLLLTRLRRVSRSVGGSLVINRAELAGAVRNTVQSVEKADGSVPDHVR